MVQLKLRRAKPSSSRRGVFIPTILIILVIITTTHYAHHKDKDDIRLSTLQTTTTHEIEEQIPIYDVPPPYSIETLPHLTPLDPSRLIPRGSYPIDVTHRNGYLHVGNILYIMDLSGRMLFLQRSNDVVTCPGTWSLLGEHSVAGENDRESVVRGVEEELGFIAINFDESQFQGAWTADFHPKNNIQETYHVTISNMTEHPLYYIRHYGPRNDNRIDRQLTYLWLVQFHNMYQDIDMILDEEVANYKWISVDEVGTWLAEDNRRQNNNTISMEDKYLSSIKGVRDDGPDTGDFCHKTIMSLYEAGLVNML